MSDSDYSDREYRSREPAVSNVVSGWLKEAEILNCIRNDKYVFTAEESTRTFFLIKGRQRRFELSFDDEYVTVKINRSKYLHRQYLFTLARFTEMHSTIYNCIRNIEFNDPNPDLDNTHAIWHRFGSDLAVFIYKLGHHVIAVTQGSINKMNFVSE